jgi:hypothetical protein
VPEHGTLNGFFLLFMGMVAVLFSLWGAVPCFGHEEGDIFSIQLENDFFGGGTDRHFTHGTRFIFITRPMTWVKDAANKLPWFDTEWAEKAGRIRPRANIVLGQNIYTPEDTRESGLVQDDRPYGGWTYLGFGVVADQHDNRYDQLELNIGMVGPASGAKQVQLGWHGFLDIPKPRGWHHQLENEPGVVLYYEQARRLGPRSLLPGLQAELIPHFGASLGNVFTFGALGLTARVGRHLNNDFGPPRIRPSLPGAGYFRREREWNWYFFVGVEGRGVLRNIFLDGNTFRSSHDVDKKYFVGDLQAGLSFQYQWLRITYTQILRTQEFKGQDSPDQFGSLSIAFLF